MKVSYFIIFISFFTLLYCHLNKVNSENLTIDKPKRKVEDILNYQKIKPILTKDNVAGSYYEDKNYWEVKPVGFSDIYNYDDKGGLEIYDRLNYYTKEPQIVIINNPTEKKPVSKVELADFTYENKPYKLIGEAFNEYYKQYYLLYEHEIKSKVPANYQDKFYINDNTINYNLPSGEFEKLNYLNYKIYEYLLAKKDNGQIKVIHHFGPRNKVNINDTVYLSLGTFQLGPIKIKNLN